MNNNEIIIGVITLIPEIYPGILNTSILGKTLNKSWKLNIYNLRKYDKHIDDTLYGGGKGMLLKCEPLARCIDSIIHEYDILVFLVPFGETWTQKKIEKFKQWKKILFICGRYEGIDHRIFEFYKEKSIFISLGNFIVTGGDSALIPIVDSLIRTIILDKEVIQNESFNNLLMEEKQFTKPRSWQNLSVPDVLIEGNHKKIEEWRAQSRQDQTKLFLNFNNKE